MAPASEGGNRVVPYFANLAAIGLTASYTLTRDQQYLKAAEGWLRWYAKHLNPDGTIDDHRLQGDRLQPTGNCDSTDSYAATFLEAFARYQQAASNPQLLSTLYPAVEAVLGAIRLTLQPDDLTWAKPSHRVKFLMDNVEVYRGWRAAARLARMANRHAQGEAMEQQAQRTLRAIEKHLFLPNAGYYAWAMHGDGVREQEIKEWYPSIMAQLMAVAWLPPAPHRKRLFAWLRQQGKPLWQRALDQADMAVAVWWGMAAIAAGDYPFSQQVAVSLSRASSPVVPSPAERAHAIRLGYAVIHRNPTQL